MLSRSARRGVELRWAAPRAAGEQLRARRAVRPANRLPVGMDETPDPRMRTALAALTPEQRRALLRVLTAPEPVRADPEQRFRKPQVVGSSPTSGSAPMFGSA